MEPPPIALPTGEIAVPTPVEAGSENLRLARALNCLIWNLLGCAIFLLPDLAFIGSIYLYFDKGWTTEDFIVFLFLGLSCLPFLALRIIAAYSVARHLKGTKPWLYGLGASVELINILVLLTLQSRATTKLRTAGIEVSLLGVSRREAAKLRDIAAERPHRS